MAIRVGRWDCPVCKTTGNLGPDKQCISCGSARPKDVKFYLADDSEIVKQTKKIQEARSGADWVCSYCNSHNKAKDTNCHTCGNDREIADGDKSLQQKINYTDGRNENSENEKEKLEKKDLTDKKLPKTKLSLAKKIGCITPVVLLIIFVILSQFTTDIELTVKSFEWERTFLIENHKTVVEDDWKVPAGGTELESYEAVHHYDQVANGTETKTHTVSKQTGTESVKVGQKDLGNGYFEDVYEEQPVYTEYEETYEETIYKDVPVYRTKYKYSILKWVDAGELTTTEKDHNAFWSKNKILDDSNYRVKEKKEKYVVFLTEEDGTEQKEEIAYEYWKKIKKGDKIKAEKSAVFGTYLGLKNFE